MIQRILTLIMFLASASVHAEEGLVAEPMVIKNYSPEEKLYFPNYWKLSETPFQSISDSQYEELETRQMNQANLQYVAARQLLVMVPLF